MHGTGPYMWREDVNWRWQEQRAQLTKVKNRVVVEEYSAKKLYFIEIKTQRISQDRINFMYNIFIQTYMGFKAYVSDNRCRRRRYRMSKWRQRFQIVRPLRFVSLDIKQYSPQATALGYFFGIFINSENSFALRLFSCKSFTMTTWMWKVSINQSRFQGLVPLPLLTLKEIPCLRMIMWPITITLISIEPVDLSKKLDCFAVSCCLN